MDWETAALKSKYCTSVTLFFKVNIHLLSDQMFEGKKSFAGISGIS